MIRYHILAALAGCALDALFGDPRRIPHPVCGIGTLIAWLEARLRKWFPADAKSERRAGAVMVSSVLLITGLAAALILTAAYAVHPLAGLAVESVMCGQMMAWRSLRKESMKVYDALAAGDVEGARKAVSMIVGRDTASLSDLGITKAAVETVAENTSDGIIAPLFYMVLGGGTGIFLYKAVNTMDSMVGYKNDRYINFGRTAARLDDGCNYIPSRLSAFFMIAAGFLLEAAEGAGRRLKKGDEAGIRHYSGTGGIRIFKRDRYNHKSPNSAQTESVCAGVLGIRLAGNACYFGRLYEKPTIGDADRPVEYADIRRANALMTGTYAAALFMTAVIGFFLFV